MVRSRSTIFKKTNTTIFGNVESKTKSHTKENLASNTTATIITPTAIFYSLYQMRDTG